MSGAPSREILSAATAEAFDRHLRERPPPAPSVSAAVFDEGGVVGWRGHGNQRLGEEFPTRTTVYRIASMSKSFLAATALALRDDGLLDLHAPAAAYVPELTGVTYAGRRVDLTLDQLLANRAGLPEDNPWGDEHLGEPWEVIRPVVAAGLRLAQRPDTAYEYSNLGQSLVGRAIETVTGRTVGDVVTERMIAPLGLGRTVYDPSRLGPDADVAHGFRTFDDGLTWHTEPFVGNGALGCIGALFSTVDDIASWAGFLRSAWTDAPQLEDVLAAASRREMQRIRTVMTSADRKDLAGLDAVGYGYGLVVESHRRHGTVVQHAGGLPGFTSHMRWHLASGLGAVVFANSDAFDAAPLATALLDDVLDRVDPPAARVALWPETLAAARRVDELVRTGSSVASLGALLTRNVLRNTPAPLRDNRIREAVAAVGGLAEDATPLEERVVSALNAAVLRWSVPGRTGSLVCEVRLVAVPEPRVQAITVSVADASGERPDGDPERVLDRYRPA